jgi:hypothetical protein
MGLIMKLSTIMGDLKDIPKSGFNEHQRYAFRKADDVDAAVSKELAKHHIILWPNCVSESTTALYQTASGLTMWLSKVTVEYSSSTARRARSRRSQPSRERAPTQGTRATPRP